MLEVPKVTSEYCTVNNGKLAVGPVKVLHQSTSTSSSLGNIRDEALMENGHWAANGVPSSGHRNSNGSCTSSNQYEAASSRHFRRSRDASPDGSETISGRYIPVMQPDISDAALSRNGHVSPLRSDGHGGATNGLDSSSASSAKYRYPPMSLYPKSSRYIYDTRTLPKYKYTEATEGSGFCCIGCCLAGCTLAILFMFSMVLIVFGAVQEKNPTGRTAIAGYILVAIIVSATACACLLYRRYEESDDPPTPRAKQERCTLPA